MLLIADRSLGAINYNHRKSFFSLLSKTDITYIKIMILFFLIRPMLCNRRYFTALDLSNGDCYTRDFQLWVSSSSIGKLSYFSNLNKHASENFFEIYSNRNISMDCRLLDWGMKSQQWNVNMNLVSSSYCIWQPLIDQLIELLIFVVRKMASFY